VLVKPGNSGAFARFCTCHWKRD